MLRRRRRPRVAWGLVGAFLAATLAIFAGGPSHAGVPPVSVQRLGVLASFFPSERDFPGSNHPMWDRLASVGSDAGLVATVELTTSSIDYMDFVSREQRVGQTTLATLNANVSYLMLDSAVFQRTTYGFDGVLLRGYSGVCDGTQPTASLISDLRSIGFTTIAIETYAQPESCYGPLADVLLNFDGSLANYGSVTVPAWLTGPTPKLWHVIYDVQESQIAATVAASRAKGADYVMTSPSSGPVEAAIIPGSSYWSSLRSSVRNGAPAATFDERWPQVAHPRSVIPAFGTSYPSWSTIHALPSDPFGLVIINPANGPGSSTDANLAAQVQALHAAKRLVLGYITAGYLPSSQRTVQDVVNDAIAFRNLYSVDGYFIDEVRPECSSASSYLTLAAQLRSTAAGFVVFNPGRNVGACFASAFDAIVNFEGPMSSYRTWTPSTWTGGQSSTKFWHLVHTSSQAEIDEAVQLSRTRQAGRIYVTTLPGPVQWTSTIPGGDLTRLTSDLANGRASAPTATVPGTGTRKPVTSVPATTIGRGTVVPVVPLAAGDGGGADATGPGDPVIVPATAPSMGAVAGHPASPWLWQIAEGLPACDAGRVGTVADPCA